MSPYSSLGNVHFPAFWSTTYVRNSTSGLSEIREFYMISLSKVLMSSSEHDLAQFVNGTLTDTKAFPRFRNECNVECLLLGRVGIISESLVI
jgi:hypothetical protein